MIAFGLIAIVDDSNSIAAGFGLLGILWFAPPAIILLAAALGVRRRTKGGYRFGVLVHGILSLVFTPFAAGMLFAALGNPAARSSFGSEPLIPLAIVVIGTVNPIALVGLLKPATRKWFELASSSAQEEKQLKTDSAPTPPSWAPWAVWFSSILLIVQFSIVLSGTILLLLLEPRIFGDQLALRAFATILVPTAIVGLVAGFRILKHSARARLSAIIVHSIAILILVGIATTAGRVALVVGLLIGILNGVALIGLLTWSAKEWVS
jgi:hypothetical protein